MLKYPVLAALFLLIACKPAPIKFDSKKWGKKDDMDFPYRDLMINDILKRHLFTGKTFKQLTDSLGEAENMVETDGKYYQLIVDYGNDIDPVYTKYLFVSLNKDSVITGISVKEWRKSD